MKLKNYKYCENTETIIKEMISLLFELISSFCLFIAKIISCSLIAYTVNVSCNVFNECVLIAFVFLNRFTKYIAE